MNGQAIGIQGRATSNHGSLQYLPARNMKTIVATVVLAAGVVGCSPKDPSSIIQESAATPLKVREPTLEECAERCDNEYQACQHSDPLSKCYSKCSDTCTSKRQDGTTPTVNEEGECYNGCVVGCDNGISGKPVDCHGANRSCIDDCPGRDGACFFAGDVGCETQPAATEQANALFDEGAALSAARKIVVKDCGSEGLGTAFIWWNETGVVDNVHVNWSTQPSDLLAANACIRERLSRVHIDPFSDGYERREQPGLRTREVSFRLELGEGASFFCTRRDAAHSFCSAEKAACASYEKRNHTSECSPTHIAWCGQHSDGSSSCFESEKECRGQFAFDIVGSSVCRELSSPPP